MESLPVADEVPDQTGLAQIPAEVLRVLRGLDPIEQWARRAEAGIDGPMFQRDPAFLAAFVPYMALFASYFDAEVRGFDVLPARGPMLLVGNHSGGTLTPDTSALFAAWYRERGLESPLYGLAFDAMFGIPGVRSLMRKMGQLPANMENAGAALDRNGAVLVYPGGEHEVFRPWTDRNRIDFNERKGFVRLALRKQVPVVPVVGHGGHESTIVLTRGNRLAEFCGLDRIRVTTFPILLQIPWGISPGGWPSLPLPAKIVVQFLEPLDWTGYGADAADDPAVVDRCYDEITTVMQDTLTELARERPCAVASRLGSLVGRPFNAAASWLTPARPHR